MKMLWFCLFLLLGLVSSQKTNVTKIVGNIKSNPCTDKNHIFLAPGVLTAGSMNRACLSRFHSDGPARLILTLLTEDRQTITASRELPSGDGGCLDINVPQLPNTKADLLVNVRYPEVPCAWERRLPLRISSGRVVVLSTERARYRPGDLIRLRVLALRQDLAPSHGQIDEIWLEGPRGAWEGSRVTQWERVRTRLGLAQLQYQLDELAPTGKWTLRAKLGDGSQGSTVFWVANYELPPFQLSVRHAPKVLRTSDRLVWTVCVRYPWSEAVEGMLVIRLRGAGGGSGGIRTAVQLRAPKACHRHAAAAKRIGLGGTDPPDVVVADFSFQEEGTRIWQNTTVVSQVVDKAITLEFLTKHRAVISPGLPYKLKVKATRYDDKPASNELVRVCRYTSVSPDVAQATTASRDSMCAEGTTDASGVARLLFAAGDDAAPFYRFEAQLSNDTTTSAAPLTLPVRRSTMVHAALGPLKAESRQARTFVPLYLHTNVTSKPFTVHFVVITRGGIIYRWGATTQCPTSSPGDQIHTAPKNSKCTNIQKDITMAQQDLNIDDIKVFESPGKHDVLMAQRETSSSNVSAEVSDALLDRHQLRVMLPIKVSHQMCPDSHLIAYFYHNGELVSASKHFEMDECFVNKAEATWQTRQAQPGSTVSLKISTPGPALCALSVLDTAAKWNQPPPSAKEQLMGGLRRLIDSHRNLTEYDAAGVCFLNADSSEVPSTSIELTSSWLAAAGVRLLGGDMPGAKHCIPRPPALLVADESTVPRSDFSEAWLWRLQGISANGSGVCSARAPDSVTRFEAAAVCVSRNGVAIAPPAVLQVFREFFIHADSPKRLRRGDSTIIRYRIFNYLYEPLSVQIQILTDSHVEGPKDLVESACVRARSSIGRRAEIRARVAAPARVSIRAKAVKDGSCGNITTGNTGVSDEVIIRIAIDAEGVPVREQKSILLCGNSSSEANDSEVKWKWSPVKAVPGTETLVVWAVSDVTGPLLADADSLVLLPRGCGEQNMAQLATNLLALQQLDPSSIAALTAREHVARGFTRQLQYVHPSGGFSAFGASDVTSSTWLTAFVVRHLRRAHKFLWPHLQVPPAIIRAERWLLNQQMENGCFRNEGQVFHRELRGGLNDEGEIASVALTAYVITSLIESASPLPYRVVRNTLSCLRAFPPLKSKTPTRVYAHALLAYAYIRLESYEEDLRESNEASHLRRGVGALEQDEGVRQVADLLKLARRSGGYVWWEASSLSTSIEATAYALLALRGVPRARVAGGEGGAGGHAGGAARWLAAHRSTSGGFVSTQDTLVALEALTAWSMGTSGAQLNVTARSAAAEQRVTLPPGGKVPDVMKIRPAELLTVSVQGTGCALIQATRAYNTLSPKVSAEQEKQLSVQVSVHTDGPFDCDNNSTTCYCAAVVEACVMWTGSFPEMALLEVTLPGGFGADAQLLYSQLNKPTTLLRRIELPPSSSRATFYLGSRDGGDGGRAGHQCYNIHATGPRVRTRPAYAKVQDYYAPSVNDTQIYTIPEECPPRIAHESDEYRSSDNLYNKARALNTDEIVITHEFSFEDIPEGIPLEDPLYDHLTETDNDRFVNGGYQEVARLVKPVMEIKIHSNEVKKHNSSDSFVPENISVLQAEQEQSHFDNVVSGYFSENESTVTSISIIDCEVNKSIEKDNNYANTAKAYKKPNGGTTVDKNFDTNTLIVGENDKVNEAVIVDHNFGNVIPENISASEKIPINLNIPVEILRMNETIENNRSNFDEVEVGNVQINEETEVEHGNWDNGEGANTKTNVATDKEHINHFINVIANNNMKIDGQIEDYSKMEKASGESVRPNDVTAKDFIIQNNAVNENIITNGVSIKNHSNFDNSIVEIDKANEGTIEDQSIYNTPLENISNNEDTETEQHNLETTVSENIANNTKVEAESKNNNDEQYDRRNNLVQEIDTLNSEAHKQLNETKSRYDVHHIDYKQLFREDDIMVHGDNNHNPDNTVDIETIDEYPGGRENEVKRSYKEVKRTTLKPNITDRIESITDADLITDTDTKVENPVLADFHVIDSETDLEVPAGIEGPIPAAVLPPPNYIPPMSGDSRRLEYKHTRNSHKGLPPNIILPPENFDPQSRMQRIPEPDVIRPELPMSVAIPPTFFAPPLAYSDFRRMHIAYPAFSPVSDEEAPITTEVVTPKLIPEPDSAKFIPVADTPKFISIPDPADFVSVPDPPKFIPLPDPATFIPVPEQPKFIPVDVPPNFIPAAADLRSLQSVYTPNGPYFYFKPDDSSVNKRYFMPSGRF